MASKPTQEIDVTGIMVPMDVQPNEWLAIAPVVICLAAGAALLMMRRKPEQQAIAGIIALGLNLVLCLALVAHVMQHGTLTMAMGRWVPPFGIIFVVDMLGALFVGATALVGFAIGLYSLSSITRTERRYGFYPFLILMIGGVSGAFLTGDVFNLYVWFEVLLIGSFGLIVLGSERAQLDGAFKYAMLNLVATTMFLIATGYLHAVFGTLNMADIAQKAPLLADQGPVHTIAALYFFAFAMKAAAFPVNFWLPASYHTPRIAVSAVFAGLLTKVGIYALLRMGFTLFPDERDLFAGILAVVAILTIIMGVLGALAQNDTRRMMGFLVISGIGLMLAGLALGSRIAVGGAILYAMHSMLAMTAAYLLVGLVHQRTGQLALSKLGGIYKRDLFLSASAFILMIAIAGLPPFTGVWPKIMLVKGGMDVGAWWLVAAILIGGLLTTIALGRYFILAFWRNAPDDAPTDYPKIASSQIIALALLLAPIVIFGLAPEFMVNLADIAAADLLNQTNYIDTVLGVAQ